MPVPEVRRTREIPELPGLLAADALRATARALAARQDRDGLFAWSVGEHGESWDHVETAMALDLCGEHDAVLRAYEWSRRTQRRDGSWAAWYSGGAVEDPNSDANNTAYIAVGVLHHWLLSNDRQFLDRMWPVVRKALDFVVGCQRPGGEIAWQRDTAGELLDEALLTGSSSMYTSLRAGLALAASLGVDAPDWELAAGLLGHAIADHEDRFADKNQFSMDWYYPVLGGPVRGDAGAARLDAQWDRFVVPGMGVRCVADEPWVTGAETCETVMALTAVGRRDEAVELLACLDRFRSADGAYQTGYQYANGVFWPGTETLYTGAAVILAADELCGASLAAGLLTGELLPRGVHPDDVDCRDHADASRD